MKNGAPKNILLIEDDELFQDAMKDILADRFAVRAADSAEQGLQMLEKYQPDVVLLDINLPGMDGIAMLKKLRARSQNLPVIMLTAIDRIPKVVESIKLGAFDYLAKPVNADELLIAVDRAVDTSEIRTELEQRRRLQADNIGRTRLLGNSAEMKRVRDEIRTVAASGSTVLIEGESGTGKELAAREIHMQSPRADKPFVAINCGAIPKDLVESELFGHGKGAFTGAEKSQMGKFQMAHKGTLLLDEISELPLYAQIKLLRVLEEQEFYPVGSSDLVRVDVRVVAASNKGLADQVLENEFREDLYFRLNVFSLRMPALRERPSDIPALAAYFLEQYNQKLGKQFTGISDEAQKLLKNHYWQGNVRELRNTIERVVLFGDGEELGVDDLHFLGNSLQRKNQKDGFEIPEAGIDLEEVEKDLLRQALEKAKFNKTRAAKLLNLSPPTFYYRLEKYGLS